MNNKFKLLALQAKMGTADFDNGSYYVATPDKMQKLCELIVRECADLLKKEAESSHDEGTETYNLLLKESKWMKKHFGVGE